MKPAIAAYSGRTAKRQYRLLMLLFTTAVNRYLYGIYARGLARFFDTENAVDISVGPNGRFRIYLNDAYWTRFVLFHGSYEPEVARVISSASGHANTFCDLGANKGYWTVFASSLFGNIISVEASSDTFRFLSENARHLPNVALRWAALHSRSNEEMTFLNTHNSHASARLASGDDGPAKAETETVETVAIDDLLPVGQTALIKLDVEGAEIAAIDGARRALAEGSVLIYEDHGSDSQHQTSVHLLSIPGIRLYSVENSPELITSTDAISVLKTDRYKGYNFLAAHEDSELLHGILEDFAIG